MGSHDYRGVKIQNVPTTLVKVYTRVRVRVRVCIIVRVRVYSFSAVARTIYDGYDSLRTHTGPAAACVIIV